MIRTELPIVTAIALVLALTAGCESNKDDEAGDRERDRLSRRDRDRDRDPDLVIGRDRDRAGRLDDRSARRPRGMAEIPDGAIKVEGGEGALLNYEPSRDGVMYVYDADDDRVIYVSRVRERERFRLDPEAGRATINSRTVFRSDLNPRHRYQLYFDRAR